MKFALCLQDGERWIQVDREVEACDLMDAVSRISDKYKPENLAYSEAHIPDEVEMGIVGYDDLQKIQAIKELRGITGLGLRESKDLVELYQANQRFVPVSVVTLDQARSWIRQGFRSLKMGPNPATTDEGLLMVLNLQQLGRK